MKPHFFEHLRNANRKRDKEWDPSRMITQQFRHLELIGEVGEFCNTLKKVYREDLGLRGSRVTLDEIGSELADVVICVDLFNMYLDPTYAHQFCMQTVSDVYQYGIEIAGLVASLTSLHSPADAVVRLNLTKLIVCNLGMIAATMGIDPELAVIRKFNATSEKQGLSTRLLG